MLTTDNAINRVLDDGTLLVRTTAKNCQCCIHALGSELAPVVCTSHRQQHSVHNTCTSHSLPLSLLQSELVLDFQHITSCLSLQLPENAGASHFNSITQAACLLKFNIRSSDSCTQSLDILVYALANSWWKSMGKRQEFTSLRFKDVSPCTAPKHQCCTASAI